MSKMYVVGVGMTPFGRFPDRSPEELGQQAVRAALADAGIELVNIRAAFCGHVFQGMSMGQRILAPLGSRGTSITNVENACCSGSTALNSAIRHLQSSDDDYVLAVGVECLTGRFAGALSGDDADLESVQGMTMPAVYAMRALRYLQDFGATREQLARVSVKNKRNASRNPVSQFKKEISIEDVLRARPIADPLNLLDCCPVSDGAAAVVIAKEGVLNRGSYRDAAVRVAASVLVSGVYDPAPTDMTFEPITRRAAEMAWEASSIGPQDVHLAEVHDCFSIAEATRVEGLGLYERGSYLASVERGEADLGGRLPINTSGGLLGKGHPLGATGIAQVVEVATQLRGRAAGRQVEGASVGVAHCRGGKAEGVEGTACTVHVFTR